MQTNIIIEKIIYSLNQPLPGLASHQKMMPNQRKIDFEKNKPDKTTRQSSVLLLLYPENDNFKLIFIKRQQYEGVHSGQIAFPGGKYEDKDTNLLTTALRETNEEIGIETDNIQILGKLTEIYIPPSNYLVQPFVGFIPYTPQYKLDKKEVDSVFDVEITILLESEPFHNHEFEVINKQIILAPCYIIGNQKIWGATSMILNEFISILKSDNQPDKS